MMKIRYTSHKCNFERIEVVKDNDTDEIIADAKIGHGQMIANALNLYTNMLAEAMRKLATEPMK